jgi:hypothetical protein
METKFCSRTLEEANNTRKPLIQNNTAAHGLNVALPRTAWGMISAQTGPPDCYRVCQSFENNPQAAEKESHSQGDAEKHNQQGPVDTHTI